MRKNIELTARKAYGAYCVQYSGAAQAPGLFWSAAPYAAQPQPLGPILGQERWIPSPAPGKRVYFCVRAEDGAFVWAADTAVEITSVENFRDMGGYRTADGRTVKWGRFFRGGPVCGMDEAELAAYHELGMRSIVDYRRAEEAAQRPDVYGEATTYHFAPAIIEDESSEMADMDMETQLKSVHTAEDTDKMYSMFLTLYERLPFQNPAYRTMFATLDSEETVPMMQHCSAGKDRTGVGCALLLRALGVDEDTVMEDYLLSAIFREEANKQYVGRFREMGGLSAHALELVARMMTVTREMLEGSFQAIARRYPSFEAFLLEEYGVTPERAARWRALHTV